eukprot:5831823-Amphidinium_carterae.1
MSAVDPAIAAFCSIGFAFRPFLLFPLSHTVMLYLPPAVESLKDTRCHGVLNAMLSPLCAIFGYVDDYVLAVAPGHERAVMDACFEALLTNANELNQNKTQIWSPSNQGPDDPEYRRIWLAQTRRDGLTLCGA